MGGLIIAIIITIPTQELKELTPKRNAGDILIPKMKLNTKFHFAPNCQASVQKNCANKLKNTNA
jgi:hypothetical protein